MFGLTRREQRWKAEQKAAEALIPLITATVQAAAEIRVAEANTGVDRASGSGRTQSYAMTGEKEPR